MLVRQDKSGKIGVLPSSSSLTDEIEEFETARDYLECQKRIRNYVRLGLAAYGGAVLTATLIMLALSIPVNIVVLILMVALTLAVIAAGVLMERRWIRIHKEKKEWWNGVKTSVNKRHVEADKKANAVRGLIRRGVGIDPQMSADLGASAAAKETYDSVRSLRL